MDIENLNRTQIVLLTLLVSFVTSIATGIVTVTLMDQAPPAVTQTIHKVVEKTIQQVAPENQTASVSEVVIVKESDVVTDVVDKNLKALISIEDENGVVAEGIVIDKKGTIVTNNSSIDNEESYFVSIEDKTFDIEVLGSDKETGTAYLKVIDYEGSIFKPIFKAVTIGSLSSVKLGQSVVVINEKTSVEILTGIVSSLIKNQVEKEVSSEVVNDSESITEDIEVETKIEIEELVLGIKTNLSNQIIAGSPLFNLKGELIGLRTSVSEDYFIPMESIQIGLQTLLEDSEKVTGDEIDESEINS